MGLLGALWRYIIRPIGLFFIAIGGLAAALNEIEAASEKLEDWGVLAWFIAAWETVWVVLSGNWLLTIVCAAFVVFMYYLFILEPYLYARRQEQDVLEHRKSDE